MEVDRARIKAERQAKRLSIRALANLAGVSQGTVVHIENGKHKARPDTLALVCKALGISTGDVLCMIARGT